MLHLTIEQQQKATALQIAIASLSALGEVYAKTVQGLEDDLHALYADVQADYNKKRVEEEQETIKKWAAVERVAKVEEQELKRAIKAKKRHLTMVKNGNGHGDVYKLAMELGELEDALARVWCEYHRIMHGL